MIHQVVLTVGAGHAPTTPSQLAPGLLTLLQHPHQLALLRRQPGLVRNGVEELLRVNASLQYSHRVAAEDIELRGCRIKKGDFVSPVIGPANRDEEMFTEPELFDIERKNAKKHLSFGVGIHRCLGAGIARMEMEVVFGHLFDLLPKLRPDGEARWDPALNFHILKNLPVRWD